MEHIKHNRKETSFFMTSVELIETIYSIGIIVVVELLAPVVSHCSCISSRLYASAFLSI